MSARPMVALLFGAGACASPVEDVGGAEDACWSLRTEDSFASVTQTYDVAVDAARGRAVSTGLGLPYLSVIDLASGTRMDAIRYAHSDMTWPRVALDGAGTAWIAGVGSPGLVRVDIDTRQADTIEGAEDARWIVGLARGVLVTGPDTGEGATLRRYDGDGVLVAEQTLSTRAAASHPEGVVVVAGMEALVLDGSDGPTALEERARCTLPFGADRVAALDDGTLLVATLDRIGRVDCATGATDTWRAGVEITDLVTDGADAWALDRIGETDPTVGVAWRVGPRSAPTPSIVTGKNSGYGEIDRSTGTLWINSEGTAEVHAYRLSDGQRTAAVSTGTFVDGLVVAPDGALIATGRLSGLVARLDGDTVTRADPVRWPWNPVRVEDAVWMLAQLDGALVAVDSATLASRDAFDLGFGANTLLTFDGLAWAEDRESLLVAESQADMLLELGLDGVERARWPLGGPAVLDPDEGAHLEVLYADGVVWTSRTYDGRVQRLDLATGERRDAWLSAEELASLQYARRTHTLRRTDAALHVGPFVFDPVTLAEQSAWNAISSLLAPIPDSDEWLAADPSGLVLLRVGPDGEVRGERAVLEEYEPNLLAVVAADGRSAWVNRSYEGRVCQVPLVHLRE